MNMPPETTKPQSKKLRASAPPREHAFEASEDFRELIDLLAIHSEAHTRLAMLQADANAQLLDVLDEIKSNYALYQSTLTESESIMQRIATAHPDWFGDKRSVKTPFGTVKLHRSTKLDIPNADASLARLEREAFKRFPDNSEKPAHLRDEAAQARAKFLAQYTRAEITLNKEALEAEDESFLRSLGIARVTEDNFSVKPVTLDLGKAVKEQAPETNDER